MARPQYPPRRAFSRRCAFPHRLLRRATPAKTLVAAGFLVTLVGAAPAWADPAADSVPAAQEESEPALPVAPRLISKPVVVLPEAAEIGTAGESVPLHLVVEADGSVSEIEIAESRGEVLDAAVLEAASHLRFEPGTVDGKATRMRIGFAFPLAIEDEKPAVAAAPLAPPAPPVETAAEPEPPPEPEMVVTGARIPERADRSVIKTQVLSREDIRLTGATTVAELLEAQPGLQVERTFRGAELWIRGLDPEYTLVLIDGVRVIGRTGGAIDLSRLPLESVERVEIVRGPASALYGSDAIGGVVNILTRGPTRPLEADADMRLATHDAAFGSARVAGRPAPWIGISTHAGHQHTAAFRRDPEAVGTTGSERRLSSAGGILTLGASKKNEARLSIDYTRTRLDGIDAGSGGAIFDRTQLQEQALGSLRFVHDVEKLYFEGIGQYSQFREQYLRDQRGSTALDNYEDNREHLGQLTTTGAYRWSNAQRTTVGFEMLAQFLESERLTTNGERQRYSPFVEHRWTPFKQGEREVLSIVPGARVDLDSQFGNQVSPKLAVRWDPIAGLTLRTSYGRGFRAPSFQELLLHFENPAVGYVVVGNPNLTAESSHSVDVSLDYRPSPEWFFSLAGFYNVLSNMIATITAVDPDIVGTLFTYDNIERAWTRGLESQIIWSPSELLTLTAGYTLTETRDEALGRPLTGRPLHRFLLRAVSHLPWGITWTARASLGLDRMFFVDDDGDGIEETAFTYPLLQIDTRLSKSFGEHFELYVGGNNLANAGDEYTALLPPQLYAGLRGTY